jgi:uracil-DNA glycosylase
MTAQLTGLCVDIAACRVCAEKLDHAPRPVVQLGRTSRILIIGQAPGSRVHATGVPWDDDSGRRLRDWMAISDADFYDPAKVALMPMGFCYPGKGTSGDLPPRPECAPLWHDRILALLAPERLLLLVGQYAHARYGPGPRRASVTERVRSSGNTPTDIFALPHPSWRSVTWMTRNPWFEMEILAPLRRAVRARL